MLVLSVAHPSELSLLSDDQIRAPTFNYTEIENENKVDQGSNENLLGLSNEILIDKNLHSA